jgi:hypothetical protein
MLSRILQEQAPRALKDVGGMNGARVLLSLRTCVRPSSRPLIAPPRARTSLYGLKAMLTAFVKKFGKVKLI